jgi:exopolyphosphatase/guanosine-5'-triphosphate,3'-diphosphate pyrophosphatase
VLAAHGIAGDPKAALMDGLEAISRLEPRQLAFCEALHEFLKPVVDTLPGVFGSEEADALMVHAATRISDIGTALHPDYRPDLAYQLVLHGPYAGVDHAERAFLALCAGVRYARAFKPPERDLVLLSEAQAQRARVLGALMRLGAVYSGRSAEVLGRASLGLEPGFLVLRAGDTHADMVSELVVRRLEQAAALLGRQAMVA